MKKFLITLMLTLLVTTQAFATYIVVLRDGTQYKAKAKWTVVNGKALVSLETGQTLSLDPALIDVAKSEQMTKLGFHDAQLIDLNPNLPDTAKAPAQPSLGSSIKLRRPVADQNQTPISATGTAAVATPAVSAGAIGPDVLGKFERAYENVGIFEHKLTPTSSHSIRVDLTVDSEDKVFNALSATSFLMVRLLPNPAAQVDKIDLFMKTTTLGSSGRFEMTRDDAQMLDQKKMTLQDYYIRKVIF